MILTDIVLQCAQTADSSLVNSLFPGSASQASKTAWQCRQEKWPNGYPSPCWSQACWSMTRTWTVHSSLVRDPLRWQS